MDVDSLTCFIIIAHVQWCLGGDSLSLWHHFLWGIPKWMTTLGCQKWMTTQTRHHWLPWNSAGFSVYTSILQNLWRVLGKGTLVHSALRAFFADCVTFNEFYFIKEQKDMKLKYLYNIVYPLFKPSQPRSKLPCSKFQWARIVTCILNLLAHRTKPSPDLSASSRLSTMFRKAASTKSPEAKVKAAALKFMNSLKAGAEEKVVRPSMTEGEKEVSPWQAQNS